MDTSSITLDTARAVRIYYSRNPQLSVRASLIGLVTWVNRSSGHRIKIFRLHDGTDFISVVAQRSDLEEDWEVIEDIDVRTRISIDARVGSYKGEARLELDTVPTLLGELNFDDLSGLDPNSKMVSGAILLARLRSRAAAFFIAEGYTELEPRYIFQNWADTDLSLLTVNYHGFGMPVYLAPSPHLQLLQALISTGKTSVYCVSKCFTTEYTGAISGVEALVIAAKALHQTLDEVQTLASRAIKWILSDPVTTPKSETDTAFLSQEWRTLHYSWPPPSDSAAVLAPEVHVFNVPSSASNSGHNGDLRMFRMCWPPNMVVADGNVDLLGGAVLLSTLTIHLERMIGLLRDGDIRRLERLTNRPPERQ